MVSLEDSREDDKDEDFVMFSESEEEEMAEDEVKEGEKPAKEDEHEHKGLNTSGLAPSRSKVAGAHSSSPLAAGQNEGGKRYTDTLASAQYFQAYLEDEELRHLMEDSDDDSSTDLPKRARKKTNSKENNRKPVVSGEQQKIVGSKDVLGEPFNYIEDKEELSFNVSTSSDSSSSEEDNEAWLSTLQKSLNKSGLKKVNGVSENVKAVNSLAQKCEMLGTDNTVRDKDVGKSPESTVAPKSSAEKGQSQPLVQGRSKTQGKRRERNNHVAPSQREYYVCKLRQEATSRKKIDEDYTRSMLPSGLRLDTLVPTLSGKVDASRLNRKSSKTRTMCIIPPDNGRSKLLAERSRDRRMLREKKLMHKSEVSDAKRIAMQYTAIDGFKTWGRETHTEFRRDLGPTYATISLDEEEIAEKKYAEIRQKEEAKLEARLIEIEQRARKIRKETGKRREWKVEERRSPSGTHQKSLTFPSSDSVETLGSAQQRPRRICRTPSEIPSSGHSEFSTEDMNHKLLSTSRLLSSNEKKRDVRRSREEPIASKNLPRAGDENKWASQHQTKHKSSQDRRNREHGDLRRHKERCLRGPTPYIAVDGCISGDIDQEQYSLEELAMAIQTVYGLGGP